jgi:hypothetical protein
MKVGYSDDGQRGGCSTTDCFRKLTATLRRMFAYFMQMSNGCARGQAPWNAWRPFSLGQSRLSAYTDN